MINVFALNYAGNWKMIMTVSVQLATVMIERLDARMENRFAFEDAPADQPPVPDIITLTPFTPYTKEERAVIIKRLSSYVPI